MKSKFLLIGSVLVIAAALAVWSAPAQATIFTFDDEYYVGSSHSSTYQSIFGTTVGYGTAGIYQKTNTTTPIVTKLSNGSGVPGEFVQDTSPNASEGLALYGWTQSLNNGQQVASVFNSTNPLNGSVLYFQYKTGVTGGLFGNGATTAFTFNSFDLRGSTPAANLSFTLEGFRNGTMVDSAVLHVTGNTLTTFAENWTNVDTIMIASTAGLPVNWGSGTLYMDNVTVNNAVPTPIPPSALLLGTGMLGMVCLGFRRRKITTA